MRIEVHEPGGRRPQQLRDEVWAVSDEVFGDHPDAGTWRREVWDRHVGREGFRLAVAGRGPQGPAGFAYGHTGRPGQWWSDRVAEVLSSQMSAAWLDGHFELVTLAVREPWRGRGLGRGLLRAVLAGLPHDRVLLAATSDEADPARRLYAAQGFAVLGPGFVRGTVVLGRR